MGGKCIPAEIQQVQLPQTLATDNSIEGPIARLRLAQLGQQSSVGTKATVKCIWTLVRSQKVKYCILGRYSFIPIALPLQRMYIVPGFFLLAILDRFLGFGT